MSRVLVACEFSGVVRDAFRELGHDAWSCDLLPCEGNSTYHYEGPVEGLLDGSLVGTWDLLIAHPPCTYLTVSGLHWNKRIPGRAEKSEEALSLVQRLLDAPIPHIALENPVGLISTRIRKPTQIIQPYQYGHPESKGTCLWLKGLPLLKATNVLLPTRMQANGRPQWDNMTPTGQNKLGPSEDRWKLRSMTYPGIAKAMAEQWGAIL